MLLAVAALAGLPAMSWGNTYFIDPNGNNNNSGTMDFPFATVQKAVSVASAGDTIYVRGGTYNPTSTISINKSGGTNNRINLWAWEDEVPIFDFHLLPPSDRGFDFGSSANWWHVKGLTIQNATDNGLLTEADNGIFERIVTRNNQDTGFNMNGFASNNLILNCDSYENYDPANRGENADGFGVKSFAIGPGNVFQGDRAWRNSDDGWDMFGSRSNGVLIIDSWSSDNGYDPAPGSPMSFNGDGNGFKLGHDSGSHIMANILAVNNRNNGIDVNGNGYVYDQFDNPVAPNGSHVEIYNSVSHFNNSKNWRFDEEIEHVLQNNVSLLGGSNDLFFGSVDDTFNSWNPGVASATTADFVSTFFGGLTATLLRGPRQSDGSLPELDYLKLAAGSDLINAGVPISFEFGGDTYDLPYVGGAPDLGAYEFVAATGLAGDYNNNGKVDAADYTAWRDVMAGGGTLLNDPTSGVVDQSDFTYWRDHFGETLGSGAGALVAASVPEPGTLWLALVAAAFSVLSKRRRAAR